MSYCTDFTLSIEENEGKVSVYDIARWMIANDFADGIWESECEHLLEREIHGSDIVAYVDGENKRGLYYYDFDEYASPWGSDEFDMTELSKAFPTVLFLLHGEGEEKFDIWDFYFQDGKSAFYEYSIEIPEFHRNDLS